MDKDDKVKIAPLVRGNYPTWSWRVELLLRKQGAWKIVTGALPRPVDVTRTAITSPPSDAASTALPPSKVSVGDPRTDPDEWDDLNERAYITIAQYVSDFEAKRIRGAKTAKETWDALKAAHVLGGVAGEMAALDKLVRTRLEEDGDAQTFVVNFFDAVEDAARLDSFLVDPKAQPLLSALFLHALPPSYRDCKGALTARYADEHKKVDPMTLRDLFLAEHQQRANPATSSIPDKGDETVLATGVTCGHCGKNGHEQTKR